MTVPQAGLEWRPGVSRLEEDLRSTAEDIAEDATHLKEIEEEKVRLEPDDPRVQDLSDQGERIAERIHQKTIVESTLAEEAKETSRKRRLD